VCAGNAKTGKLECKGDNGHGELRAAGMDLSDIRQLTVGADTTFVLTTAGEIKYFGTNGQSQQSGGARPEGGKKIWSITALSYSLLVRFHDNTWKCYGRQNECGPVRDFLNREQQVKYLAQMRHGACVIRMDDTVWCASAHHGVGNVPSDLGEVSALNCGCCWCVAVRKSDGRFKAWGYDGHGEVRHPNGGIYQSSADWVNPRSYVCEYHTCYAINQKGESQRWGWNSGRFWSVSKVNQFVKDYPDAQFVSTGPDGHQFLLWSPSANKLEGFGHHGHEDGANIGRSANFELADSPEQCRVMGAGRPPPPAPTPAPTGVLAATEGFEYMDRKCSTSPGRLDKIKNGPHNHGAWDCMGFDTRTGVSNQGPFPRGISFKCVKGPHATNVGLQWAGPDARASKPDTWDASSTGNFKQMLDAFNANTCQTNKCAGTYAYNNGFDAGFSCRAGALYRSYNNRETAQHIGNYNENTVMSLVVDGNNFKWYVDGKLKATSSGIQGKRGGRSMAGPFWAVGGNHDPRDGVFDLQYISAPGAEWSA